MIRFGRGGRRRRRSGHARGHRQRRRSLVDEDRIHDGQHADGRERGKNLYTTARFVWRRSLVHRNGLIGPVAQSGSDRRIGAIRVRVVNVERVTGVHVRRHTAIDLGRRGNDLRRGRTRVDVGKLVEVDLWRRFREWSKFAGVDLRKQFLEVDLGHRLADVNVARGAGVEIGRRDERLFSLRRCGTRFARLFRGKIIDRVVVRQDGSPRV